MLSENRCRTLQQGVIHIGCLQLTLSLGWGHSLLQCRVRSCYDSVLHKSLQHCCVRGTVRRCSRMTKMHMWKKVVGNIKRCCGCGGLNICQRRSNRGGRQIQAHLTSSNC